MPPVAGRAAGAAPPAWSGRGAAPDARFGEQVRELLGDMGSAGAPEEGAAGLGPGSAMRRALAADPEPPTSAADPPVQPRTHDHLDHLFAQNAYAHRHTMEPLRLRQKPNIPICDALTQLNAAEKTSVEKGRCCFCRTRVLSRSVSP